MKLSLEQIKSITVGALEITEENGTFRFAKCTTKQIEVCYRLRTVLGDRAKTTTGIRLDFHTNSNVFAFEAETKGKYDIYIDNVLTYFYRDVDFNCGMKKEILLDGKEHRITLYFPAHTEGILRSVEIDNSATLSPHKFDCKILFLGDSITQGWDSTWDSLSYAQNVSRFFDAESIIQGIGGSTFYEDSFDSEIQFEPDIVIVAYGTNDWNAYPSLAEGREHCARFLDKVTARYCHKKLFGISPLWRADQVTDTSMGSFQSCTDYVKEEILSHKMILIEGDKLTPHLGDFYVDECLHPNTAGYGIYALNLIAKMKEHLS